MYDRIHPDAHAEVPRVAAAGIFEQVYARPMLGWARRQAPVWLIGRGQFMANLKIGAVEVTFQQPYKDKTGDQQLLIDKMYLVKTDGEWRWFFGRSRAFVDAAIKQFGRPQDSPLVEGDLVVNVLTDLDTFYADVLSYTPYKYESPGFVYVKTGTSTDTVCGPPKTGFWGFSAQVT